jgi:Do/DeqQ family serine protease
MNIPRLSISDITRRPPEARPLRRGGLAAAGLVVAGSLTAFALADAGPTLPADVGAPVSTVAAAPAAGADTRTVGAGVDSYAAIVDRVAPAVVTVRSSQRVRAAQQFPFAEDPLFERFFGERLPGPAPVPEGRRQGLGSGVIVTADGYILTNHHVIDGAENITVELVDRRTFKATVIGSDPPSDLAVLKIDGKDFPTLPLGDSEQVRVGDVVLAVGNPMGVGQTVTMGIVSAKGRSTGPGDGSFEDFLQTDAPINTGNSGGALVSTRGELVGINSQILSPSGGNIGIGFAIPANMAENVMQSLIQHGRVHRGMIGVTAQTISPELARSLRLSSVQGALVADVSPDSPAAAAGIERRDVITAVNGAPVADSNALRNMVSQLAPGTRVELTVVREGRERSVALKLAELPSEVVARGDRPGQSDGPNGAGLSVQPLTPDVARRYGVDARTGLLVTGVASGSAAAESGFRRGDVIEKVDGKDVQSVASLRDALAGAGDRPALVLVRRAGSTLYLALDMEQA